MMPDPSGQNQRELPSPTTRQREEGQFTSAEMPPIRAGMISKIKKRSRPEDDSAEMLASSSYFSIRKNTRPGSASTISETGKV